MARTELSGDISGRTLESGGNPYIVTADLFIPEGEKTTFSAGCVLLFNPFTGITVDGSLSISGTAENPVTLTSINDSTFNNESTILANPFDWNGILITRRAQKVILSNFVLAFSVYGVKSQITSITVDNGTFRKNGQFHFTTKDTIRAVVENIPFSYNGIKPVAEQKNTKNEDVEPGRKASTPNLIPLGAILSAGGLGCLGVMGYFFYDKNESKKRYDACEDNREYDKLITAQEDALGYAKITGIIGGALLPTGILLFIVDAIIDHKAERVSFVPLSATVGNGLCVKITF